MARNGRAGTKTFDVKAWREKNRERIRRNQHKHQIFKLYGLTAAEYDRMLIGQAGRCSICEEPMRKPCVDHDHTSGKVRSLLCNECNLTLGWIEQPALRSRFDAYIQAHR